MMFLDAVERDGSHTVKKYLKQYEMCKDPENSMLEKSMVESNHDYARYVDDSRGPTTFWRRFIVLVMREFTIAARNPSLYYLQFSLLIVIGIFVGAVFYSTKSNVDVSVKNVPAGIVWIIFMMSYVQIFKVRSHRLVVSGFALLYLAFHFTAIRYGDHHPSLIYRSTATKLYRSII
jgi:ABC-2 type transporter